MRRGLLILVALLALLAAPVGAAGTCTQSHQTTGNIRKVTIACTADAADATFPATVLTAKFEGRLLVLETDPGATAPTDNYDIAITNAAGVDVLQGVGANRDTATTEQAQIVVSGTSLRPTVDETDVLTLAITNNSTNSAVVTLVLYYALGG